MKRAVAALAGLAALCAGVLAGAATAAAHAELVEVFPAAGEMVTTLPGVIELTFSEPVGKPADVVVLGPDGAPLASGDLVLLDTTATLPLEAGNTPAEGWYTISYQVTSVDGHLVTGTTTFMLHGDGATDMPAGAPAGPGAVGPGGTSTTADPVVVGSLVLALVAVLVLALGAVRRMLVAEPAGGLSDGPVVMP